MGTSTSSIVTPQRSKRSATAATWLGCCIGLMFLITIAGAERIDLLKKLEIENAPGVQRVPGFCASKRKRDATRSAFRITNETVSIQPTQHVFREFVGTGFPEEFSFFVTFRSTSKHGNGFIFRMLQQFHWAQLGIEFGSKATLHYRESSESEAKRAVYNKLKLNDGK